MCSDGSAAALQSTRLTHHVLLCVSHAELSYTVMIDAGSSGSRVYLYSYLDPTTHPLGAGSDSVQPWDTLDMQLVRRPPGAGAAADASSSLTDSDPNARYVQKKTSPGLSSYAPLPPSVSPASLSPAQALAASQGPAGAWASLVPLIEFAAQYVPPSKRAHTPLYVLATAGMRMLSEVGGARARARVTHLFLDQRLIGWWRGVWLVGAKRGVERHSRRRQSARCVCVRRLSRRHHLRPNGRWVLASTLLTVDWRLLILRCVVCAGIYGWIALNAALRRFKVSADTRTCAALCCAALGRCVM